MLMFLHPYWSAAVGVLLSAQPSVAPFLAASSILHTWSCTYYYYYSGWCIWYELVCVCMCVNIWIKKQEEWKWGSWVPMVVRGWGAVRRRWWSIRVEWRYRRLGAILNEWVGVKSFPCQEKYQNHKSCWQGFKSHPCSFKLRDSLSLSL